MIKFCTKKDQKFNSKIKIYHLEHPDKTGRVRGNLDGWSP